MQIVGAVERVRMTSRSQFEAYAAAGAPVVVEGAVESWPALRRWSPEYLGALLGDIEVRCKASASNAHPDFRCDDWRRALATERMPFRELMRRISTGPALERARWLFTGDEHYVLRVRDGVEQRNAALQPLMQDFSQPTLVPSERLYSVWAWFSAAGVRTWLHYDNNGCHNLNVQVCGAKRAWLIAPQQLEQCDMFPLGGENPAFNCSRIDVEASLAELPPGFASVRAWAVELRAGDALFIPVHWLHTFEHTGSFNANVNFWWKPDQHPDDPVARREAAIRKAHE